MSDIDFRKYRDAFLSARHKTKLYTEVELTIGAIRAPGAMVERPRRLRERSSKNLLIIKARMGLNHSR